MIFIYVQVSWLYHTDLDFVGGDFFLSSRGCQPARTCWGWGTPDYPTALYVCAVAPRVAGEPDNSINPSLLSTLCNLQNWPRESTQTEPELWSVRVSPFYRNFRCCFQHNNQVRTDGCWFLAWFTSWPRHQHLSNRPQQQISRHYYCSNLLKGGHDDDFRKLISNFWEDGKNFPTVFHEIKTIFVMYILLPAS